MPGASAFLTIRSIAAICRSEKGIICENLFSAPFWSNEIGALMRTMYEHRARFVWLEDPKFIVLAR